MEEKFNHNYMFVKGKIYPDPAKLVSVLDSLKAEGKKIVFGNGCFELIHVGHIRYLFAAKELGDILVVAVNTDESMKRIKPDRDPVNPDHERMEIIASIEAVDYVIPLSGDNPAYLLEMLKPDFHTKGTDYADVLETIPEWKILNSYGGKIKAVGDPKDHSTTDMLEKLK